MAGKLSDAFQDEVNRKRHEKMLEWMVSSDCTKTLTLSTSMILSGLLAGGLVALKDEEGKVSEELAGAVTLAQKMAIDVMMSSGRLMIKEDDE